MDKTSEIAGWKPERLVDIYNEMCINGEAGELWRNIPGAKEIMHIMKNIAPERDSEINPAVRMLICESIIGNDLIDLRDTPRLYLEYLEYWKECHDMPKTDEELSNTELDADFKETAEEMSRKVRTMLAGDMTPWDTLGYLKYDPVQLSPQWEENIYEIEKECDARLKGEMRGMGFCYAYWSAKRAVAAEYGIDWVSPSGMNPGVMFD